MKYLLCDGITPSLSASQDGLVVERALTNSWSSLPSVLVQVFYPARHETEKKKKKDEEIRSKQKKHNRAKNVKLYGLKQNRREQKIDI